MTIERFSQSPVLNMVLLSKEEMPTDACIWFYECSNCKTVLKPKGEDCCVFCSYGGIACPPVQQARQKGKFSAKCC